MSHKTDVLKMILEKDAFIKKKKNFIYASILSRAFSKMIQSCK